MEFTRINMNTCSKDTKIIIEDGIIKDIEITGGCSGNLKGIMSLVIGMKPEDVIEKLKGITCGPRITSCPDQVAITLEEMMSNC